MSTYNHVYWESHKVQRQIYNHCWHRAHQQERHLYGKTYREEHSAETARRLQIYKLTHRLACTHRENKRRARHKALPNTFSYEQEQFCRQYFHYACTYCGKEEGFLWCISMDHFIPLASPACPGSVVTNMLPACDGISGCNPSKGNRDPYQWLLKRFGKRQAATILAKIETYFTIVRTRHESTRSGL